MIITNNYKLVSIINLIIILIYHTLVAVNGGLGHVIQVLFMTYHNRQP